MNTQSLNRLPHDTVLRLLEFLYGEKCAQSLREGPGGPMVLPELPIYEVTSYKMLRTLFVYLKYKVYKEREETMIVIDPRIAARTFFENFTVKDLDQFQKFLEEGNLEAYFKKQLGPLTEKIFKTEMAKPSMHFVDYIEERLGPTLYSYFKWNQRLKGTYTSLRVPMGSYNRESLNTALTDLITECKLSRFYELGTHFTDMRKLL